MNRYFYYKKIFPWLGLLLFIFILFFYLNPQKLWLTISQINFLYLIPVFILSLLILIIKSWRWQILMKKQNINYSFKSCLAIYSATVFLSLATPGKMGELAKIFYLLRDNQPLTRSLVSIVMDRLMDLLVLIALIFLGLAFFLNFFLWELIYILVILFLILILFFLLIKTKGYLLIFQLILPRKYHDSLANNTRIFFQDFRAYTISSYIFGLILTLMVWFIYLAQVYLLALSLNISLNFLFLLPMTAAANAADLLPISINGLGTRDAIFIFFLSFIGVTPEKSMALSILQLYIVFSMAIIGLIFWLKKPIPILEK